MLQINILHNYLVSRYFVFILCIVMSIILFIFGFNIWINWKTSPFIFNNINNLPNRKVGLVLGTSKYYRTGIINKYYLYRILGAIHIYNSAKVNTLILSGDNAKKNYNEPITMRHDLIAQGIPANNIILDFAGFNTFDSIFRIKKVFNINNFTIITQQFHCERALFIALYFKIKAQCYAVPPRTNMFLLKCREIAARLNLFSDLYITKRKPRFFTPLHITTINNNIQRKINYYHYIK